MLGRINAVLVLCTIAVIALTNSCAKSKINDNVANCNIPDDQRGSFLLPLEDIAVNAVADTSFTPTQKADLQAAALEWNILGRTLVNQDFFTVSEGTVPDYVVSADPNDCAAAIGDAKSFFVMRVPSAAKWASLGLPNNASGATFHCGDKRVSKQIVYINTFSTPALQNRSVMLHELGHALGLDHSCTTERGRSDYKTCTGLNSKDPYRVAVMYPNLSVMQLGLSTWGGAYSSVSNPDAIERKETLQPNDKERTACLYSLQ